MSNRNTTSSDPRCLECDHRFTDKEIAAITARAKDELSVLDCASCGSHNLVHSEPQQGFNQQPALVVLRVASGDIDVADAFKDEVEPGVYVHPVTAGSSG